MKLNSITTKLIAMGFLSCVIPVIIVTVFTIFKTTDTMITTIGENLQDSAEMVGSNIDVFFDQRDNDAKVISQSNVLESNDSNEQKGYFDDILDANENITSIMVVDADGNVFSKTGSQAGVGKSFSAVKSHLAPLFTDALKGRQGDVFFGKAQRARWNN